jgi:hypothetical protein
MSNIVKNINTLNNKEFITLCESLKSKGPQVSDLHLSFFRIGRANTFYFIYKMNKVLYIQKIKDFDGIRTKDIFKKVDDTIILFLKKLYKIFKNDFYLVSADWNHKKILKAFNLKYKANINYIVLCGCDI